MTSPRYWTNSRTKTVMLPDFRLDPVPHSVEEAVTCLLHDCLIRVGIGVPYPATSRLVTIIWIAYCGTKLLRPFEATQRTIEPEESFMITEVAYCDP